MERGIVILNIIGSMASIIGLAFVYHGTNSEVMRAFWQVAFVATLILSMYVLMVPGSALEKNVCSKLRTYRIETESSPHLFIQEDEQIILGSGPLSVKFPVPFCTPPEVELINTGECGNEPGYFPEIKEITRFQFIVKRPAGRVCRGSNESYPDKFKWIATGQVMSEVTQNSSTA